MILYDLNMIIETRLDRGRTEAINGGNTFFYLLIYFVLNVSIIPAATFRVQIDKGDLWFKLCGW